MVADWLVEDALARGKEVIYTAPVKALSNQKFRDYCKLLGEEKVGLVTGDLVIRRDAPCRVMTTEILRNMLLSGEKVPDLAAVIIDEIHFLDDRERGTTWEEVLIYLPSRVRIVGLSATLSNVRQSAAGCLRCAGIRYPWSKSTNARSLTCVATREGRLQTSRKWAGSTRTGPAKRASAGCLKKKTAIAHLAVDAILPGSAAPPATPTSSSCSGLTTPHTCISCFLVATPSRWPAVSLASSNFPC